MELRVELVVANRRPHRRSGRRDRRAPSRPSAARRRTRARAGGPGAGRQRSNRRRPAPGARRRPRSRASSASGSTGPPRSTRSAPRGGGRGLVELDDADVPVRQVRAELRVPVVGALGDRDRLPGTEHRQQDGRHGAHPGREEQRAAAVELAEGLLAGDAGRVVVARVREAAGRPVLVRPASTSGRPVRSRRRPPRVGLSGADERHGATVAGSDRRGATSTPRVPGSCEADAGARAVVERLTQVGTPIAQTRHCCPIRLDVVGWRSVAQRIGTDANRKQANRTLRGTPASPSVTRWPDGAADPARTRAGEPGSRRRDLAEARGRSRARRVQVAWRARDGRGVRGRRCGDGRHRVDRQPRCGNRLGGRSTRHERDRLRTRRREPCENRR